MKNKLKVNIFFFIFYFLIFNTLSKSNESFVFDVTEVEIIENGNIFLGKKKELQKQIMELLFQLIILNMIN